MNLTLQKIAEYVNGKCFNCGEETVEKITTDTRDIEKGSLFVALKGEKFDGHDFLDSAIEKGAVAVLSEKVVDGLPLIKVENTYKALLDIAKGYRESLDVKVVGVTGSVGKTTTKDMIAAVLSQEMPTAKTQGNFNNHIGVPKTLFLVGEEDRAAVVEMGMNHKGEISALTKVSLPDIAVLTCIGVSHIENLGSRENILKAKLEILEGMAKNAPVIINVDNDILGEIKEIGEHKIIRCSCENPDADFFAKNIAEGSEGARFDIYCNGKFMVNVFLPCLGVHNVGNALLSAAVGIELGVSPFQIASGLSSYVPSGRRQKIVNKKDITFIEDCYNASPQSMVASLGVLKSLSGDNRSVAVLGDMLELGDIAESSHLEIGHEAAKNSDLVVCSGNLAKKIYEGAVKEGGNAVFFESKEEAAQYLVKTLKKDDFVLFKASNSMQFDKIIEAVYAAIEN